jgi:hypothetical protein
VAYLLLTDDEVFACRSFDGLAAKLLWAREQGHTEVKARFANGDVDRPLLPFAITQDTGDPRVLRPVLRLHLPRSRSCPTGRSWKTKGGMGDAIGRLEEGLRSLNTFRRR